MRSRVNFQEMPFSYISSESRVRATHPLRRITAVTDQMLHGLSPTFAEIFCRDLWHCGLPPSIPSERLLKCEVLVAWYSAQTRQLFSERLDTELLFQWFLNMNLDELLSTASSVRTASGCWPMPRPAVFRRGRSRCSAGGLLSDEHCTVDGTLIEAWTLLTSVTSKKPSAPAARPDDPAIQP